MSKEFAEADLRIFKAELPPVILLNCCIDCWDVNHQKSDIWHVADFVVYRGVRNGLCDHSQLGCSCLKQFKVTLAHGFGWFLRRRYNDSSEVLTARQVN